MFSFHCYLKRTFEFQKNRVIIFTDLTKRRFFMGKRWFPGLFLILSMLFPVIIQTSCQPLNYTLTVIVEEGVTGTPETGKYKYKELSTVEFSYLPLNPLHTVEVLINDKYRKSAQDSITLYGDEYVLRARIMDVRGTWKIKMTKSDSTSVNFEFTVTLTGNDVISGTFTDSRGYHGIWDTSYSYSGNIITLTYADWKDYVLTGTYFDMKGNFMGEGTTGSWTSERVQ